jgi:predicted ATPase
MKLPETQGFTYIIGNNGSGKSRSLEENAETLAEERPVIVISSGAFDKFTYRARVKRTANGSYNYQGNRTVGNGTHNGTLAANVVLLYVEILEKRRSVRFRNFLASIGFDKQVGIGYRKTKSNKTPRFDTSQLSSKFVAENPDILRADEKPFEAVFYKNEHEVFFSHLSSGEQNIISTALKIVAKSQTDACFFIDEPEVSLHVEWQIRWPEIFQPLLEQSKNVSAYIATHSPVIIASALKTNAACYTLKDGELNRIVEKEFNVEKIIFRDFNTLTPNNKNLYSELATITSKTVSEFSQGNVAASAHALAAVQELKSKLLNASQMAEEQVILEETIHDFEMAIREIIDVSTKSKNIVKKVVNER